MKPPPFTYHAPRTLDEALRLASQPNARVLAGGQSLMPMLNMRVVAPDHVVDLGKIPGLAGIREEGGTIAIGAMTRQRDIEFSPLVREKLPLLGEAIDWVGHRQTRNRGTIGGSLCHLDPSAEQPTVAMAMDATLTIAGPGGKREVAMRDFAVDLMTTALEENEILTELRITPWAPGHGWAFVEFARRHGDFAIVAVAVLFELDNTGRAKRVSLTLGGVNKVPLRMAAVEARLTGSRLEAADLAAVAKLCGEIDALDDPHVPAWYRQRLAATLSTRALSLALTRAQKAGK
jgi:carbon-monoxide dehydrogenase medium subunit